ncbi:hypothetical protein BASA50_008133 [Batrachochytrium salamandrivorans]|uniref:Uncharacterized protein n=1 Tax=Batrachochytrium salamandrivorans TaxID=1357716 RepID=A0ABQ8F893_9FUNG|nr:hypothetical protein BASA50_008133 [Batrachochytrium salamandrivorans]
MQFFCLLSFVAAILPTCIKLQRGFGYFGVTETTSRFWGPSGRNRGSGPPPSPLLTPEDVEKIIAKFFKDSDFTSANISSTIDKVGDGAVDFYKDGEKAGKEIGGTAGPMLKRYLDRDIYVIVALIGWMVKEGNPIMGVIRSVMGDEKYYKFFREFITALEESAYVSSEKEGEVVKAVSNILTKTGTVTENVNTINTSFKDLFDSRIALFTLLGSPLKDSEAGKILYGHISNVVTSLGKFVADQQKIHDDIIKALGPPPPK